MPPYRKWKNFLRESTDSNLVAKVIIYNNDKILFLKTDFDDSWDIPGGHLHVDEVENPVSGLRREVEEETGLKIGEPVELYRKKNRIFYKAMLPSGKIRLSNEHIGYKFLSFEDIDKYNIARKFREAVEAAFIEK